ncbi:MAG: hypothetical protein WCY57_01800, partial [Micavibrio sp.]
MSQDEADSMNNAAAIIERFGGIRPTAAKVGAPVTTVQGWKKRDVIPASRRGDVVRAARENGIDLSDLAGAAGSSAASAPSAGATDRTRKTVPAEKSVFIGGAAGVVENAAPKEAGPKEADKKDIKEEQDETAKITVEPLVRPQTKKPLPPGYTGIDTTHEELMDAIARGQKKAVSASVWTAVCIAAVLAGAGVLAFLPSAKKIERHEEKIASIEGQMGEVNETARSFKDLLPEDMRQKMAALKEEAAAIRSDVQRVAKDAQDISRTVLAADAGSLSDRLSVLEAKFGDMEGGQALKDLTARIRNLEVTIAGQEQIQASVAELTQIVDSIDGQVNALGDKMAEAKKIPGSALGETLEGVSGNDMKAAALLIAFSQLRDSLNRNEPFENDLALLQKLVGNDDPELQMALARLAPQAEKGGVLTAQGLSGEL